MNLTRFVPLLLILHLSLACAPQDKSRRSPLLLPTATEPAETPLRPADEPTPRPAPAPPQEKPPQPASGRDTIAVMGSGFNLGNLFDRAGQPASRDDIKAIIDLYYAAGFRHVRIPTTWMDGFDGDHLANASAVINTKHPRFLDLVFTIDYALGRSMHVVLNAHHEHWLKKDYQAGSSDVLFGKLWQNIGRYFANYPHELIFEVLNEPEGRFGDFSGTVSPFQAEAIALTRHINAVGYEAIRASAPGNKERIILIMPNAQGNQSLLDEVYPNAETLPAGGRDPYLALSVHTYDPWDFCGQDGSNAKYPGAANIMERIQTTAKHAEKLGLGLNYGEFGVGRKTTQDERNTDLVRQYYRIMGKTIRDHGFSPTLWDDRGWFGLVEKTGNQGWQFRYGLAPAALQ
ncbi:MAG TPA: cellulase family glycosylhydrolase [Oligoflexus sp.]|uniref:glycoside hydrolase family 5 protein n=1 Tax=Oligoflexus sp. TaxID=1971216 RepID=UPI002D7E8403|nr:cellulase family glycosylhydrolase [Oligoflexus sp.]HET9235882.1 cellulase family glycosylhydrolase [Oligoflexus sp.]